MAKYWKDRNVLVVGGNGFIGSFIVEKLIKSGAKLRTTASSKETLWKFLDKNLSNLEVEIGNLHDTSHCKKIVREGDIVIYMAAEVGGIEYNMKHPGSIFRNNMIPFLNTIEAAKNVGVERFVTCSSACVYQRHCTIPTPESEGFDGRPEPTNKGYGWSKRMEEFVTECYHEEFGLNAAIARPYNAYGPRDDFNPESSHVIAALIRRIEEKQNPLTVWGDGTASRSFLYAEDFAEGVIQVAEKSLQVEAINIGADEEITIRELVELMVRLSGHDLKVKFDATRPTGQPRRKCDNSLAKRMIGYEPKIDLEEGLRRTFEWYRDNQIKKMI
jgi:GDP-L-fucose synthase